MLVDSSKGYFETVPETQVRNAKSGAVVTSLDGPEFCAKDPAERCPMAKHITAHGLRTIGNGGQIAKCATEI